MKIRKLTLTTGAAVLLAGAASAAWDEYKPLFALGYAEPEEDQLVHIPPTLQDLEDAAMSPELKDVVRRGHDLFVDTQQLRGQHVFNDMNCASCHMDAGRQPFSAALWPAAITLPDYRGKNWQVNSLEERVVGCFTYSMNGNPPEYGSDTMLAITTYMQRLAKGAPVYPDQEIYGRGYGSVAEPEQEPNYERGKAVYAQSCAICHAEDGQGLKQDGQVVFPPLWGDGSYNWGAGMSRINTSAAFIKHNMPLGQPNSLSDQEAWDVAFYMNSHERPQDPRYTGDVHETREKHANFHGRTLYGTVREVDGHLLGDHDNTGEKDFLRPEILRSRTFD